MAFWGIELKPGKPYTHVYDNARGRLRISQATLGNGKSTNKSTVQCNIGNKSPILLCNLIPNSLETCHLELEFEEAVEVVFSVLGQRSVHLSGYYIGSSGRNLDGDGTDSYGEDIADTDTSGSYSSLDDEDEYESDFIDDDDIGMFPHPHRRKSGVVIEEIVEDDKPSNENGNRRRLKKKHLLNESDDGGDDSEGQLVVKPNSSAVLESEDEDGFPISFSSRKKNVVKDSEGNLNLRSDNKTVDEDMKKMDTFSEDGRSRETSQPCDTLSPSESGQENKSRKKKKKKKKKAKDGKPLETTSKMPAEETASVEPDQHKDDKEVDVHKDNAVQFGEANVECKTTGADDKDGKAKKKKKKKGKTTEARADVSVERTQDKSIEDTNEAAKNDKMDQDLSVSGKLEKLPDHSEMVHPSVPSATNQENSRKLKKKNKKKRAKDERGSDAEGGEVADVNQTSAKKKKKESKNNDKDLARTQESGEHGKSEVTKAGLKTRTYPNGLVIEELAMGKPDGERATPGKKVFVNYIGKLKDGRIFDSTVGKRPFAFRLGIGQVIKGWDVGVNGMRVGDKRRLSVPPSYGYGQKKMGPIPPNSWLMFDVELVSVN